ncbi:MAG: copper amine oxidase N-terminal domain-containing protein [Syntrophomonadaceae bacterium]|jgi:hypothetical protein
MKKKWLVVILATVLICALAAITWANEPIKLVVDGQEIKPDVAPQIIGDRTMVPVRWIAEALGAEVEWDAASRTVIIRTKANNIDSDPAAVSKLIEDFGKTLKNVSLLAPGDAAAESIKENYADYVSPALLAQWQSDPANAPGRVTSSPWPERIEIIDTEKLSDAKYQVKGEIIEVTSVEMANGGYAAKRPISLVVEKVDQNRLITAVKLDAYGEAAPVVYQNSQYGFSLQLPESWQGYAIISDQWKGWAPDTSGDVPVETGALLSIRHPQWTLEDTRQDIPIMVFTMPQWNALQQGEFSVGSAPVAPKELGRNSQYVFALPARYNFAFPTGYEEVEEILENDSLKTWEGALAPEQAEKVIKQTASRLIKALSTKNADAIADLVHPTKGVRFTPYTYVSLDRDLVFSQEEMRSFFDDQKVYLWGNYDGSGFDIELTPSQYYEEFVYDEDYINADQIGYNQVLSFGNALENQFEVYDNPIVVEYYFPGLNPDYGGMDWSSLRLVFESYQNDWKLVGIINNQWTI